MANKDDNASDKSKDTVEELNRAEIDASPTLKEQDAKNKEHEKASKSKSIAPKYHESERQHASVNTTGDAPHSKEHNDQMEHIGKHFFAPFLEMDDHEYEAEKTKELRHNPDVSAKFTVLDELRKGQGKGHGLERSQEDRPVNPDDEEDKAFRDSQVPLDDKPKK